ncbi:MAG: TonB-dependent receptor [Verrucomicrobiota bacterium JB022]|nr:TonB-dependent receptor [Verrucomicrobiota bacterium JB022]
MKILPTPLPAGQWAVRLLFACLSILCLLSPSLLLAQETGTVRGRVQNASTQAYVRNAIVTVVGSNQEVLSTSGGNYVISGVPAGTVTIRAAYSGLETTEQTVEVTPGETATANFTLRSAFAATPSADEDDIVDLEAFEISSEVRSGNALAIMEQKVAINPQKVIAADSLGNISEGNAGEFLKLMPGVSLDYVEADARAVRISGLAPQYGNVLLEGLFVPNAGSSNIATGRTFEFEQLSMDSVEMVALTKTPTPDQPSALSGTVNLVTKSAFDRDGEHIEYSLGLATNSYYASLQQTEGWDSDKHYKLLPNYSLEYSNVFMDGDLGVVLGTSNHHTIAAQKHIWLWANDYNTNPNDNDTEIPVYNWIWLQDGPKPTQRSNYYGRIDYRFSDRLTAFFRADLSKYESMFYNRTISLRPDQEAPNFGYDLDQEYSMTSQTVANGSIDIDSNQFMEKLGDTTIFTAGLEYQHDNLTITGRVNWGKARNWYENFENGHFTDYAVRLDNISWRWDRDFEGDTGLQFTQLSGPDWRDHSNYNFQGGAQSLAWHERNSEDVQSTSRIDVVHDWRNWSLPQQLKYGVLYNRRELEVHRYGALRTSFTGPDGVLGTADDPNPADYVQHNYTMDFDVGTNLDGIHPLSPWQLYQRYREYPGDFVDSATDNGTQRRQNNWYFEEEIFGAYLTDVISLGSLEVAPGLRYETSTPTGRGYDRQNDRPISREGDSVDVLLKYLHLTYDLTDTLVLRASYHDSVTRANIANLIPGISSIDDTAKTITAANPNIQEERAKTFYFTVEKYFEPVGVFSVSAFHRIWEDRLLAGSQITLGPDGYLGDTTYAGYTLLTNTNARDSVKLNGIEFDFNKQFANLPQPLNGLGIFANATFLDYDDWRNFQGSPKMTANGGFNVEIGKFSARLNANYTGKILNTPGAAYDENTGQWNFAAPYVKYYQKERLFLDLNLEYAFSSRYRIFLDARNITNEPSVYTYRNHEDNFERILKTGTIWKLGVKGVF